MGMGETARGMRRTGGHVKVKYQASPMKGIFDSIFKENTGNSINQSHFRAILKRRWRVMTDYLQVLLRAAPEEQ